MAKKDNFGAAMFDMFGVGGKAEEQAPQPVEKHVEFTEPEIKAPERKAEPVAAPALKPNYGKSIVATGTTFEGNITAHGDIEISGELKGNIYSEGKVTIMSKINGNIKAGTVAIFGCEVGGDIEATDTIELDVNSSIVGNISATNIVCAGSVTGDLDIKENLSLSDTAVINGNIKMASMSVARGAKITGKLEMQA